MKLDELSAISPIDGRYGNKTAKLRTIFGEYGLIAHRLEVEIRWIQFLAKHAAIVEVPEFDTETTLFLNNIIDNFSSQHALEVKEIEKSTNHDVKAVEYYLKKTCENHPVLRQISEFFHFACTSEDINNLAYALMVLRARENILLPLMQDLQDDLNQNALTYCDQAMLSRTHGQPATPTSMGKEFANFSYRLYRQLQQFQCSPILGKLNGAVGNFNAHMIAYPNVNWSEIGREFVTSIGLSWNPYTTQIEPHDYLSELFHILIRLNCIILDFDRDMWSYISIGYFKQKSVANEVGSSTMPHKVNPIDFENSEGNLGIANAIFDHLATKLPISRLQRDLTDSTAIRNVGVAFAHTLIAIESTRKGISKLEINKDVINNDLLQNWEILAEPIQTTMRRYGVKNSYEILKTLTRGQKINAQEIKKFIDQLDIPQTAKDRLSLLTPATYLGNAVEQAKKIVEYTTNQYDPK